MTPQRDDLQAARDAQEARASEGRKNIRLKQPCDRRCLTCPAMYRGTVGGPPQCEGCRARGVPAPPPGEAVNPLRELTRREEFGVASRSHGVRRAGGGA
jgi:hypothetical protein